MKANSFTFWSLSLHIMRSAAHDLVPLCHVLGLVLWCSFQEAAPAYLLTPLDRVICQVDYVAFWWYICFIAKNATHSLFYTTVLSRDVQRDIQRLREHVDIWDKDYRVIIKECLCCVSLSLLTLLSDRCLCCRTELGPVLMLSFYTLQTHSRVEASQGLDPPGLSGKVSCQSSEAVVCVPTPAPRPATII